LQTGANAARTGVVDGPLPLTEDVSFIVELPGTLSDRAVPLIHGGDAYLMMRARGGANDLRNNAIYRVSLSNASVEKIATLEEAGTIFAIEGQRIFVADSRHVTSYPLAGGPAERSWAFPESAIGNPFYCSDLAVDRGEIFVYCLRLNAGEASFVAVLSAETLEPRWVSYRGLAEQSIMEPPTGPRSPSAAGSGVLAVIGDHVLLSLSKVAAAEGVASYHVIALARANGAFEWQKNSTQPLDQAGLARYQQYGAWFAGQGNNPFYYPAASTGDDQFAYMKLDGLIGARLVGGNEVWRASVRADDGAPLDSGSGLAIRGSNLFVTTQQTLYRFDTERRSLEKRWLLPSDQAWATSIPLIGPELIYARSYRDTPDGKTINWIHAFNQSELKPVWSLELPALTSEVALPEHSFGAGEGVIVTLSANGQVRVIGSTPMSISAWATPSTLYPALGSPVWLNLTGFSPAGISPLVYAVDWGEGSRSDWNASAAVQHTYTKKGDYVATVYVRNEFGQSNRFAVSLYAGTPAPEPPPRLNFVQRAFSESNQDMTWGLLGIFVALPGGVIGIVRLQRRRRRLERELDALAADYEATKKNPLRCEAVLQARRTRAQSLLMGGKLEQGQFTMLERRIEELRAQLRLGEVGSRLDFLPLGLYNALQAVLKDGNVSPTEHTTFLAALEKEQLLTPAQKKEVRAVVDEWFRHDAMELTGQIPAS
jgi:hypothetical protein